MKDNATMSEQKHSISRRAWLYAAGAAAGLAGGGLAWWRLAPQAPAGTAQHEFWKRSFDAPSGDRLAMAAFTGSPLLVNFWATWCPPCVEELPLIDQPSAVKKFLLRQVVGFPIGLAGLEGAEVAKSLGNAAGALPFSVFFNADGTIWRQKLGQLRSDDLIQWRASRT
jgi:thiol:disulfide interchange protein